MAVLLGHSSVGRSELGKVMIAALDKPFGVLGVTMGLLAFLCAINLVYGHLIAVLLHLTTVTLLVDNMVTSERLNTGPGTGKYPSVAPWTILGLVAYASILLAGRGVLHHAIALGLTLLPILVTAFAARRAAAGRGNPRPNGVFVGAAILGGGVFSIGDMAHVGEPDRCLPISFQRHFWHGRPDGYPVAFEARVSEKQAEQVAECMGFLETEAVPNLLVDVSLMYKDSAVNLTPPERLWTPTGSIKRLSHFECLRYAGEVLVLNSICYQNHGAVGENRGGEDE